MPQKWRDMNKDEIETRASNCQLAIDRAALL